MYELVSVHFYSIGYKVSKHLLMQFSKSLHNNRDVRSFKSNSSLDIIYMIHTILITSASIQAL